MTAQSEMQLRIDSDDGSRANDYRIRNGQVEVRSVYASAKHAYSGWVSTWRGLDDADIQFHHILGTVVSKWLRERLNTNDYALGRAA